MIERRRHPRAESNLPLKYKNLRSIGESQIGSLTRDISEGGVRFKTSEFISLACRLVLEISLPMMPKPVKAISKVAWIRKVPTGDYYEIGNQFLEITKEDKSRITEFVNSSLRTGF
jgi:c-di-GMP-binding flagellar brake protein YcgR